MNNKKILFLGYNQHETHLINFLEKKGYLVKKYLQKELTIRDAISFKNIISFGYRKIIKKKILSKLTFPIINLHMSYLPYNRGSHPNYWSFVDKTQAGVTIHEINQKVDQGDVIYQKKIHFDLDKSLTFKSTYDILFKELENLFIKNYKDILNKKYNTKKIFIEGTFHKKKDLPKNIEWNQSILDYLKKLN